MSKKNETQTVQSNQTMSKTDKEALKNQYREYNNLVLKAQSELDKALADRSNVVKRISEALGNGPFVFDGRQVTIVCRKEKNSNKEVVVGGKETYFFKGPKGEVTEL